MAWIGERVAGYKRVRQIEFTDHTPRFPAGKILRRLLADEAAPSRALSGQIDRSWFMIASAGPSAWLLRAASPAAGQLVLSDAELGAKAVVLDQVG
jgi:hypothetical protein